MSRGTEAENAARFASPCCGALTVMGAGRQRWCTSCFGDVPPPQSVADYRASQAHVAAQPQPHAVVRGESIRSFDPATLDEEGTGS